MIRIVLLRKAQLLRLSFEYNEKKKDYYLSYNSVIVATFGDDYL